MPKAERISLLEAVIEARVTEINRELAALKFILHQIDVGNVDQKEAKHMLHALSYGASVFGIEAWLRSRQFGDDSEA